MITQRILKIIKDRFILSRELMNDKSSGDLRRLSRLPRLESTKAANSEESSSRGRSSRPGRKKGRTRGGQSQKLIN